MKRAGNWQWPVQVDSVKRQQNGDDIQQSASRSVSNKNESRPD